MHEPLKSWKIESDITALILLTIAVVLAFVDHIAAGSLVAGLFVVVVLFRTLPQMRSFKGLGFEVQWFKQVVTEHQTNKNAVIELRADMARLNEEIKAISAKLPAEALPALQQLNSTSVLANEKLTIVENANTALDALLNRGPRPFVDENKIFHFRAGGSVE